MIINVFEFGEHRWHKDNYNTGKDYWTVIQMEKEWTKTSEDNSMKHS